MLSTWVLSKKQSIYLLIVVATLWSSAGFLIKIINWHPLAIAGVRSLIAAIILSLAFAKTQFKVSPLEIYCSAAYSCTVILFILATKLTTAANAVLLQYTSPIYVAILGRWILYEQTTMVDWLIIFTIIGGMTLFFYGDLSAGMLSGNLLAIVSGISYAIFVVLLRKQKNKAPVTSVILGNVFTFLVGLPFMFAGKLNSEGWIALVALGIFQLGISDALYSVAIKKVTALEAIVITSLEPILNPVWVYLFLGEIPTICAVFGGFVILSMVMAKAVNANRNHIFRPKISRPEP